MCDASFEAFKGRKTKKRGETRVGSKNDDNDPWNEFLAQNVSKVDVVTKPTL